MANPESRRRGGVSWQRPVDAVAGTATALLRRFGIARARFEAAAPRLFSQAADPVLPEEIAAEAVSVAPDAAPDLLGLVYERALHPERRLRNGAVYTPRRVAEGLVRAAVDGVAPATLRRWRVIDPSCGAGVFLLAAGRALADLGVPPAEVAGQRLWGLDIDSDAVAVAEASLALWLLLGRDAGPLAGRRAVPEANLRVADALLCEAGGSFDLVIGNPPFLGQLDDRTRHSAARRAELKARWAAVMGSYTDAASLFLVAGRSMLSPGGRLALVQPLSVLGARDAAHARRAAVAGGRLHGLWVAPDPVFAAAARTCAPVIELAQPEPPRQPARATSSLPPQPVHAVQRWVGARFEQLAPASDPGASGWAALALDVLGVPSVELPAAAKVSSLATATAGFRQQFYGLAPFVVEVPDGEEPDTDRFAPLITTGLIDVGCTRWGERPARFARRRWMRPAVDLQRLREEAPALATWVAGRLRPKVVVATQSKVVEAAADLAGVAVPSVPVISVEPMAEGNVARLAAALAAPPAAACAFRIAAGTALSANALKLAARQVLELPLPPDEALWSEATELLVAGDLAAFAVCSTRAFGLVADHPVVQWWLEQAVARRRRR